MKAWKPENNQKMCASYYGNMTQLGGIRRSILAEGRAKGVEALDFNTGGGLTFTVLPGRGMDIAGCSYRGIPVSYIAKAGIAAPEYHDSCHDHWLKNFFAGLMTTCGMSNAGPACWDEHPILGKVQYGLHGDCSNTGAEQVGIWEDWTSDGYVMKASGKVSEGRLHGEHLTLRRTVTAMLGEKRFVIHDEYRNEGTVAEPLMFFYHINIGHPILDGGTKFLAASKRIWANSEVSKQNMERYDTYLAPQQGVIEQQYFHELYTDAEGKTTIALINEKLELGFYLTYSPRQMPYLAQWKVERPGDYVTAFEPGNCHPIGREEARKQGILEILNPFESHTVDMELGIADGREEIGILQKKIEAYR